MEDGLLSLKWNNHKSTFFHILSNLRKKETYTDATLACDGKFFPVHKLVMSTCSDYFSEVFERTTCKSPVVILKDIRHHDLEALLDYMYLGEVDVKQSELAALIKAAECLRIKGLAVPDEDPTLSHKKTTHVPESRASPSGKRSRRESGEAESNHHFTSHHKVRRSLSPPSTSSSRSHSSLAPTSVPSQSGISDAQPQVPSHGMPPPVYSDSRSSMPDFSSNDAQKHQDQSLVPVDMIKVEVEEGSSNPPLRQRDSLPEQGERRKNSLTEGAIGTDSGGGSGGREKEPISNNFSEYTNHPTEIEKEEHDQLDTYNGSEQVPGPSGVQGGSQMMNWGEEEGNFPHNLFGGEDSSHQQVCIAIMEPEMLALRMFQVSKPDLSSTNTTSQSQFRVENSSSQFMSADKQLASPLPQLSQLHAVPPACPPEGHPAGPPVGSSAGPPTGPQSEKFEPHLILYQQEVMQQSKRTSTGKVQSVKHDLPVEVSQASSAATSTVSLSPAITVPQPIISSYVSLPGQIVSEPYVLPQQEKLVVVEKPHCSSNSNTEVSPPIQESKKFIKQSTGMKNVKRKKTRQSKPTTPSFRKRKSAIKQPSPTVHPTSANAFTSTAPMRDPQTLPSHHSSILEHHLRSLETEQPQPLQLQVTTIHHQQNIAGTTSKSLYQDSTLLIDEKSKNYPKILPLQNMQEQYSSEDSAPIIVQTKYPQQGESGDEIHPNQAGTSEEGAACSSNTPQDLSSRPPRIHLCHFCQYSSKSKVDLNKHIRVHTREKPYKCMHCRYETGDKSNFKRHVSSVHKYLEADSQIAADSQQSLAQQHCEHSGADNPTEGTSKSSGSKLSQSLPFSYSTIEVVTVPPVSESSTVYSSSSQHSV